MKSEKLAEIRRLEDKVRELTESEENRRRLALWEDSAISNDYWHGIPKEHKPLFTVELERATYAHLLGFSIIDFYQDPYAMVEGNLKMMAFKFENLPDCTPIGKSFAHYPGAGFEKALYGGDMLFSENDAWMAREDLITERVDIKALEPLDFYKSGCMPKIIELYHRTREIMSEDFTLSFPQWSRSPFGVAWHIRGIENLLCDVADDEEWVNDFINYITDCRIQWVRERAKYLNIEQNGCNIYNDEVTSPMISPSFYRDIIRPTEIRLSEAFGGVHYWHSCGNTTPYMEYINTIPKLQMVTVSAWSDLKRAEQCYDKARVTLEKQIHPYDGIMVDPTPEHFRREITDIATGFKESKGIVRLEGVQMLNNFEAGVRKVRTWCDCAGELLL